MPLPAARRPRARSAASSRSLHEVVYVRQASACSSARGGCFSTTAIPRRPGPDGPGGAAPDRAPHPRWRGGRRYVRGRASRSHNRARPGGKRPEDEEVEGVPWTSGSRWGFVTLPLDGVGSPMVGEISTYSPKPSRPRRRCSRSSVASRKSSIFLRRGSWRSVYAGELEVRPQAAPTTGPGRHFGRRGKILAQPSGPAGRTDCAGAPSAVNCAVK